MSWFYAEGGVQKGPVSEHEFAALVQAGRVQATTLVWREGMADWQPYGSVAAASASSSSLPPPPPGAPPLEAAPATGATVVCSECGRIVSASDTVQLAGRTICATCKPVIVQRMVEGADAQAAHFDPEQFLARLRARGGYHFSIGDALSRGLDVVKTAFWPSVGVAFLMYVVLGAASQIPCAGFVVTGPITGGLFYYFLLRARRQPATINEAFAGFRQPRFRELAIAGAIVMLVTVIAYLVTLVPAVVVMEAVARPGAAGSGEGMVVAGFILLFSIVILAVGVVTLMWYPSYLIIMDRGIGFWPAMELSRKLVFMRFWRWVGFVFVGGVLSMVGLLALCIGFFIVVAVLSAAMAVIWEDILRQGAESPAPGSPSAGYPATP